MTLANHSFCCTGQLCWNLYQSLLQEPVLLTVHYQVNSATHRAKTRIWQALAVLSPVIPQSETHQTVAQLWPLLQVSNTQQAAFSKLLCTPVTAAASTWQPFKYAAVLAACVVKCYKLQASILQKKLCVSYQSSLVSLAAFHL